MDVKETVVEFYKINYDYHNVKEQMFWLAATLYLGFAGGSIALATSNVSLLTKYRPWIVAFSILVLVFSECFVLFQNWYKARSVFIDNALCNLLRRFDVGMKRPKYWEVSSAMESGAGTPGFHRIKIFFQNGRTGVVAMSLMLIFGIAQIACLCSL